MVADGFKDVCPKCGGNLKYYDSVNRKVVKKGAKRI